MLEKEVVEKRITDLMVFVEELLDKVDDMIDDVVEITDEEMDLVDEEFMEDMDVRLAKANGKIKKLYKKFIL